MGATTASVLILLLVVVVFPPFFVALWIGIVLLMSLIGGWGRLAEAYPAALRPTSGEALTHVTGMFGITRYKQVLTVIATEDGLYIETRKVFRPGHQPLFIPFDAIYNARRQTLFFWEYVAFDVGEPAIAHVRLPSRVFDEAPIEIER